MGAHFNPEAMKFLRGLARNNDREWFNPRKTIYERELMAPIPGLYPGAVDAPAGEQGRGRRRQQ